MRFNQHPLLINTLLGEQNNPLFFFFLFSLVDMVSLNEIRFNLHPLLINIEGYNDPAPVQVVIGALKVTKASLVTVIPLLGFLKHRYLQ